MDSVNINSKSLNIPQYDDQTWVSNDYRDTSFDYSYASSNSSFSCGSLTSGSLTSQSSVSASTPRRQSLCSALKLTSNPEPFGQVKDFRRPRTPMNMDDQYPNLRGMTDNGYTYTTPQISPSSRELENMFIMDAEDTAFSNKLQTALGLDSCGGTQASSLSGYEGADLKSQGLAGQGSKLLTSNYPTNHFSSSIGVNRNFGYQGLHSEPTYTTSHNSLATPQTVVPSQTTYQAPQSAYAVPQTPPRALGDAFVSPLKTSFESSPMEEPPSIFNAPEDSDFYGSGPETTQDPVLQSLGLQTSFTKSEYTDDDSTLYSQSTSESPVSDTPSLVARRRSYRKGQSGSRSAESSRKRAQKPLPFPVKKESVSRHACPKCMHRKFKRPEHLKRHLDTVHGEEENRVRCLVRDCPAAILKREDNLKAHYRKTHMYGPCEQKGKKRVWLSIEAARELGLGDIDPRTNPPASKSRLKAVKG